MTITVSFGSSVSLLAYVCMYTPMNVFASAISENFNNDTCLIPCFADKNVTVNELNVFDLPQVLQTHQVKAVCEQCAAPLSQLVVVAVHVAEEAVKAAESIVSECLRFEFHHILNEDVLDRLWLQIFKCL